MRPLVACLVAACSFALPDSAGAASRTNTFAGQCTNVPVSVTYTTPLREFVAATGAPRAGEATCRGFFQGVAAAQLAKHSCFRLLAHVIGPMDSLAGQALVRPG